VLEYLGLSMKKDQVVNTSIDGTEQKRALIPYQLVNAKHWWVRARMHDYFCIATDIPLFRMHGWPYIPWPHQYSV
jgi:hypothetical protein